MKNFLNDRDGMTAKDFLLLLSSTVFFLFVIIGLIRTLLNKPIDNNYISLLQMISPVLMTVVGGVFGVQAVDTFANRKEKSNDNEESYYGKDDNNRPTI